VEIVIVTGIEFKAALLTGHNVLVAQPERRASRRGVSLSPSGTNSSFVTFICMISAFQVLKSRQAAPSFDK
jgi:hypothetical protein